MFAIYVPYYCILYCCVSELLGFETVKRSLYFNSLFLCTFHTNPLKITPVILFKYTIHFPLNQVYQCCCTFRRCCTFQDYSALLRFKDDLITLHTPTWKKKKNILLFGAVIVFCSWHEADKDRYSSEAQGFISLVICGPSDLFKRQIYCVLRRNSSFNSWNNRVLIMQSEIIKYSDAVISEHSVASI